MTAPGPKHSLPAGVLPVDPAGRPEDAGSRVRAKAPPAVEARRDGQGEHRDTPADRAQSLVAQLVGLGPKEIAPVIRRLLPLGNFALEEIARRFPEPLWPPSLATDSRLPRPDEISATAAALATFEEEAVPYLVRLMHHPRSTVRYYAAVICAAYANVSLVGPLAQTALDEDRNCRHLALHLLSRYQHEPAYQRSLANLRRHATDAAQPPATRRRAISALTQLRDDASVPLFVDLLASSDRGIAAASRVGLRILTAHDFGFSREPWLRWYSQRGQSQRAEWLIEGLGDGRPNIRVLASRELWTLTRQLEPLGDPDDRDAFLAAQKQYERWRTNTQKR